MRLFWWNTVPNLGDRLTAWMLAKRGESVTWAPPAQAEMVGIGSVLEHFDGLETVVWGTGRAGPKAPPTDLTRCPVRALRGLLTLEHTFGAPDPVLGDPGLCVSHFYERVDDVQGVAVVPHWQDVERLSAIYTGANVVDVGGDIETALDTIRRSERVISSSLHGIVLADAYRKPRMWEWFPRIQADGWKFEDYQSVMGPFEPGTWNLASDRKVRQVSEELLACL